MKPSTTPDARGITHSTTPGEVAFKHESASSDPSQGDAMVPDQAKDSQTTPGRQDILSTQHPSRNVQENITGDKSGENKPSRPSSSVLEGKSPKVVPASAPGIQLGSAPNEVALEEKKLPPSGQDSAYPAQPPSSAEPRSKDIEYLSPSTQLNSTIEPRNGDAIVAAPDQAKDSQETPGPQLNLPTPSSYTRLPSRKPQEDEPTDNLVEAKSSKPPSVIEEDKPSVAVPVSAPDTQHGQHSPHSVHPSFSAEPTKEDTVIAAIDQTSTMEKIVDQNYMTSDLSKVKTPFSGTHSSRETQKGTRDEKLASQWRVSPDRHVSESPKGLSPEVETLNTIPDSTPIYGDARLNSDDVPAESSLPETQDLQVSASAHNVPADSVGKIKSPRYLSTEQVMAPIMSPTVPSVSPLGAIPGTNSVQVPRPASTVNLESVPETQHGMPQGGATPAEQKNAISDQESAHISELPTSSEPRKEAVNVAAVDQPNVLQGPETTAQHKVKAPSSDAREALQKDQQHSHVVLPSDLHDGPTSEVLSAVVDKETPLLLSQEQTSTAGPNSILTTGDVPPTSSLKKREAEPPAATQAPTSQVPQSSVFAQNDSLGSIDSPRQASTDQVTALMIDSAAPSDAAQGTEPGKAIPDVDSAAPTDAAQGTEPGRNSSQHPPFSTETTKDTVVTANQAEDMHTITHQQAITPAPGTAKTPFPSTQYGRPIQESAPNGGHIDKPRPSQEQVSLLGSMSEPREGQTADPYGTNIDEKINTSSSSQANNSNSRSGLGPIRGDVHPSTGEGPAEIYYPEPGAQTQLPAATQDRSLEPSSKAKSIGQGAKAPTEYLASSPDTQLGSSETQSKAALAKQKIDVSDKKSANAPRSPFSAEPTEGANADQTSGPETTVTNQVASTTPDASDTLGEDQESSRDDHISNSENLLGSKEAASYAGYASEESVDKEMTLPPRETQNSNTGPDSTPYSSDAHLSSTVVPDTSSIQNQNVQPPATRSLTSQAVQGSSPSQIAPDSLEKLDSPRLPSTMEPVTSPAAPLGVPQGTEPGMHSVQPSQEASELSSDEKIPTTQGDQVNTLPNADLSTNQVVGQSEGADFKGINSQWYLKGASTNERNRTQQQTDQFGNQSFKDNNNGADGTVRSNISTTSEEFQKQPSSPRKESSEKPENQQQADQAIVESLESNEKQAEQTKPHDTETIEPEDMEASENTNEKNNRKPLVETLDHSEKQASGVQQLGENTKDAPNSTEDTSGDVQAVSKSEDDSRSSEESKVLQQSEDKNQGGETVAPNSDIGHPIERDLPANSYQHNSSQSQAEAPDKSVQQPSPGIQNKDNNSSRSDGSTDPTKPGYMKD